MRITVNGYDKDLPEGVTLETLIIILGVKTAGLAVDINREVVPKSLYNSTVLKPGDAIELVRMVGGG